MHQPFASDRVGMVGGSALGITQYLCAGALHPALKCCYATVGTGYNYDDMFFTGGVFRKSMVEGWLAGQGSSFFVDELEQHPNRDSWWDIVDITARAPLIGVPFLHVGGWYDIFQAGTTRGFRDLAAGGAPQKMVIGPWTHGGLYGRTQGELTFPVNAGEHDDNFDNDLRFFEYWLKGVDNGYEDSPRVRYYVMGDVDDASAPGNAWRTAESWPPDSAATAFWLTPDGGLTTEALRRGAVDLRDAGSVSYRFDPSQPAPTTGGNNLLIASGPYDQRPVEARDDVLVFTTAPLEGPVEVTGDVSARLFISSDRLDTDFMVKLCDVYPDGRSMLITEGALHARHRLGHTSEHLLVPGQLYWMDVDMWGTSVVFNAGHRIRVSITSSSDPKWEVNPNSGEAFRRHTRSEIATNRVFCAPGFWSRVVLPVVD
ncbi:MAG: CocE/NonD family hydrolase [Phycisphaerales bacterium]|nr:CocE/NonD family hydrolase [Phycisphaerales bacterium]